MEKGESGSPVLGDDISDMEQFDRSIGSEPRSKAAWMSRMPMTCHRRWRISRSNGFTGNGGSDSWRERDWAMRSARPSIVQARRP